jgi:S1-C subfamily serine protease
MKATLLFLISALVLPTGILAGDEVDLETLRPGWLGFGFNYSREDGAVDLQGRLRVCGVEPGSPAQEAGLEVDDVITEMDGEPFDQTRDSEVLLLLARVEPGQTVTFTVQRGTTSLKIPVTAGPTTSERLERWRLNFQAAREQEAQEQEFVLRPEDGGGLQRR